MNSVVSYPDRNNKQHIYGNNKYRGNCSGRLIEDIIDQYHVSQLSDFMVGGGTTKDVCNAKGIAGSFADLNSGYDMMTMDIPERSENVFWHPPYGGMIKYSDCMYSAKSIIDQYGFDPRPNDLSRAKGWDDFVKKMNYCMMKQFASIDKGGRMFVLMGDWKQKGKLYSMLSDIVKPGTLEQIIIKMQHNCTSDSNTYSNKNFVPICHEYLMVVRKDSCMIFPLAYTKKVKYDIRDSISASWRDILISIVSEHNQGMHLSELYDAMDGHRKCANNPHWKEKIRQQMQTKYFLKMENGVYKVA